MPRPKAGEDLVRVTVRVERRDLESLKRLYPRVGYNRIVRALISRHLRARERNITASLEEELGSQQRATE